MAKCTRVALLGLVYAVLIIAAFGADTSCTGGQVYSECVTPCAQRCDRPASQICSDLCIAGCTCPLDTPIWDNVAGKCVKERTECSTGCVTTDGTVYANGDMFAATDGCNECICNAGQVACTNATSCAAPPTLVGGVQILHELTDDLLSAIKFALSKVSEMDNGGAQSFLELINATSQVVAGVKYTAVVRVQNSFGESHLLQIVVLSQPWLSPAYQLLDWSYLTDVKDQSNSNTCLVDDSYTGAAPQTTLAEGDYFKNDCNVCICRGAALACTKMTCATETPVPSATPDPCANMACEDGTQCQLSTVECVAAPCDPVAKCVPVTSDGDGSCTGIACTMSIPACKANETLSTVPPTRQNGDCCNHYKCVPNDPCTNYLCPLALVRCLDGYVGHVVPATHKDGDCCDHYTCIPKNPTDPPTTKPSSCLDMIACPEIATIECAETEKSEVQQPSLVDGDCCPKMVCTPIETQPPTTAPEPCVSMVSCPLIPTIKCADNEKSEVHQPTMVNGDCCPKMVCTPIETQSSTTAPRSCLSMIACPKMPTIKCADNEKSEVHQPTMVDGDCCPTMQCVPINTTKTDCSIIMCMTPIPSCSSTQRLVRTNATGVDGFCCDRYECVDVVPCISGLACPVPSLPPCAEGETITMSTPTMVDGDCCPVPSCTPVKSCDGFTCARFPLCSAGETLVMTSNATMVPPDCCNKYACVSSPPDDCSNVKCNLLPLVCPTGTIVQVHTPTGKAGDCCQTATCVTAPTGTPECSMVACKMASINCAPGARAQEVTIPGNCCPEYKCVPADSDSSGSDSSGSDSSGDNHSWVSPVVGVVVALVAIVVVVIAVGVFLKKRKAGYRLAMQQDRRSESVVSIEDSPFADPKYLSRASSPESDLGTMLDGDSQ